MDNQLVEKSIITCKGCGETKERFLAGKYPDKRNKRWVDSEGREFCGFTCPSCHSRKIAVRNKNKRDLQKLSKEINNGK